MADLEKLFHQVTENFKTLSRRIRRLEKAADEIGITGIRIREIDAVPTLSGINTIEFTNGTVSGIAPGVARITSVAGMTITEIDGTPALSGINTLEFSNGTVSGIAQGVARITTVGGAGGALAPIMMDWRGTSGSIIFIAHEVMTLGTPIVGGNANTISWAVAPISTPVTFTAIAGWPLTLNPGDRLRGTVIATSGKFCTIPRIT